MAREVATAQSEGTLLACHPVRELLKEYSEYDLGRAVFALNSMSRARFGQHCRRPAVAGYEGILKLSDMARLIHIENEPDWMTITRGTLPDYVIDSSASYAEGLSLIRQNAPYDLALVDLNLERSDDG